MNCETEIQNGWERVNELIALGRWSIERPLESILDEDSKRYLAMAKACDDDEQMEELATISMRFMQLAMRLIQGAENGRVYTFTFVKKVICASDNTRYSRINWQIIDTLSIIFADSELS